eukprot:TRINITY_DN9368_c0_g1_i1.p1 TRINITY_DN9368_c0_g1~~TRINITY_DN9368_c0_g1_i1.p1  ORF type:complete len:357 (+),score=22.44 TRINITY_DN9368_c0_g1_i1:50-1072(+)
MGYEQLLGRNQVHYRKYQTKKNPTFMDRHLCESREEVFSIANSDAIRQRLFCVLPVELEQHIVDLLDSQEDLLRVRSVCKNWASYVDHSEWPRRAWKKIETPPRKGMKYWNPLDWPEINSCLEMAVESPEKVTQYFGEKPTKIFLRQSEFQVHLLLIYQTIFVITNVDFLLLLLFLYGILAIYILGTHDKRKKDPYTWIVGVHLFCTNIFMFLRSSGATESTLSMAFRENLTWILLETYFCGIVMCVHTWADIMFVPVWHMHSENFYFWHFMWHTSRLVAGAIGVLRFLYFDSPGLLFRTLVAGYLTYGDRKFILSVRDTTRFQHLVQAILVYMLVEPFL